MNLILRLLKTLTLCFFKPKMAFFDSSVVTVRVWLNDMDHLWHLTNSKYLSFMDLGRMDYMHRTGHFGQLRKHKCNLVMASATLKWRFSLKLFDRCEIHTKMLGWDGKYLYMSQRILKDGQIACDGLLKAVYVSQEGSLQVSEVLKTVWGYEEKSPKLPDSVKGLSDTEKALSTEGKDYVGSLS